MRFIVGVFGKAGSGKSYLIQSIMDDLPRPVFIVDSQAEFNTGVQFETADELLSFLIEGRPNVSGIYVLNSTTDLDFDTFFRILATAQDPATVVIDEADLFCTPYNINPDLARIIKYGRHWKQHIVYAARRPAEVNRNLTAQSDCLISFKQTEPRDIAALKKSYAEAEALAELDETNYECMILGRYEHLPFSDFLEGRALTKTVPDSSFQYREPEDPEDEDLSSTEEPKPSTDNE